MAESTIHTCTKTGDAAIDCTACQLAQLCDRDRKGAKRHDATSKGEEQKAATATEGDDYSISTELTAKGNDYSILYLVIIAAAVFAAVILFYKLFIL